MNGEENWIRRIDDWDNIVTGNNWRINIIWKPFDYGRLSYLYFTKAEDDISMSTYGKVEAYMMKNKECYQQTVLERPEELSLLILDFLQSITDKKLSQ